MLWVAMMVARPRGAHQLGQSRKHMVGGVHVKVSGRLVGQQDPRRIGDRAGDGHPLLLAAGQFRRTMGQPLAQAEIAEQFDGALVRLAAREAADHLRQQHVLQRGEFRQQMMRLIDEADLIAANAGALVVGQAAVARPSI